MLYMVTFPINIPPMLAYIPYMDPMGTIQCPHFFVAGEGMKSGQGLKNKSNYFLK